MILGTQNEMKSSTEKKISEVTEKILSLREISSTDDSVKPIEAPKKSFSEEDISDLKLFVLQTVEATKVGFSFCQCCFLRTFKKRKKGYFHYEVFKKPPPFNSISIPSTCRVNWT